MHLLLLLACSQPPAPTMVPVARLAPPPLGGSEALRVSVDRATANQRFELAEPFVWELKVPEGAVIPGRGLPPDLAGTADLQAWYRDQNERSVIQLELPTSRQGLTDEESEVGSIAHFDPSRFCRVGDPACLWAEDDDGRWRAWRVRDEAGTEVVTELQLAHTWLDPQGETPEAAWRIIGVWMDSAAAPLDEHDRVRFEYVGHVPAKATQWLGDRPLRPRLRFRPASDHTDGTECPNEDYSCWTMLDDSDVQPLEILPGPARWLQVIGPLDTTRGQPMELKLVSLDEWSNPTPLGATAQLALGNRPFGAPLDLTTTWTQTLPLTPQVPGMFLVGAATTAPVGVIRQYVRIWEPGNAPYKRLVGDVHIHSGLDGTVAFARSSLHGDHRGNFVHGTDALRYLREVAGHDFGALSEHAVWFDGWLSSTNDPTFGPGGLCDVTPAAEPALGDWWLASQQMSWEFQQQHPDFTVFPAYEWHGALFDATYAAKLHRIALFREHVPGSWDIPMLPGNVPDRPPQCLYRWLDDHGYDNSTVLVMPHMMLASPRNFDWELAYQPSPIWEAVAGRDRAEHYQTVGEIYSSRNHSYGSGGFTNLVRYEGTSTATPGTEPYSWRVAWRETEAVIGVIGASDNHVGMPGGNDWDPNHPDAAAHEPGGAAFVLADPQLSERDGIYEALRNRATYATSGIRAHLDWTVTDGVDTWRMGAEIAGGTRCGLSTSIELAAGQNIRTLSIWGTEVGSALDWQPILFQQPINNTQVRSNDTLENPVPLGGAPQRWVYYVRAFTGPTLPAGQNPFQITANHREAVWSSPVWVDWEPADCP